MNVLENMPHRLIHVRCRRCHKNAGVWNGRKDGTGFWQNDHVRRCRCDPPPSRPDGAELDELVAQAWLLIDPTGAKKWTLAATEKYNGRAPMSLFR